MRSELYLLAGPGRGDLDVDVAFGVVEHRLTVGQQVEVGDGGRHHHGLPDEEVLLQFGFLPSELFYLIFEVLFFMLVADHKFLQKSIFQIAELFLEMIDLLILLPQPSIVFLLLLIDIVELPVFLVQTGNRIVPISNQIAIDLILIFVFYYILVQF